jgi:hypothetical protein
MSVTPRKRHTEKFGGEGVPTRRAPERRLPQHAPAKPSPVMKIDKTRDEKHQDSAPANAPKTETELLEELLPQDRRLDAAQHWGADDTEKQHATNPDEGGEDMNEDARKVGW